MGKIKEFTRSLLGDLTAEKVSALQTIAQAEVSKLKTDALRREMYDGKRILDEFYKRHIHQTGMSKEIFVYECARQASKRQSVVKFVEALFAALGIEEIPKKISI